MTQRQRHKNASRRTGHVAPDETLDPSKYVAHIEGAKRVLEHAPRPFDSVEAAVAWAQERAQVTVVRLYGEDFVRRTGHAAGQSAPPGPRWPPQAGERVPAQAAPAPRRGILELHPDHFVDQYSGAAAQAQQRQVVAAVLRVLTDAGFHTLEMPRTEPGAEAIASRWERAGRPEDFGWTTTTALTHRIRIENLPTDLHQLVEAACTAVHAETGEEPWRNPREASSNAWGVTLDLFAPALLE